MRTCLLLLAVLPSCNQLLGISNPTAADATGPTDGRPDDAMVDGPDIDAPPPCTTANAFGAPITSAVGGTGVALAVGDLSPGTEEDVAIAITTDTVILQNEGAGAFGTPILVGTASTTLAVDFFDRLDLRKDLALVTATAANIVREAESPAPQGTFQAPQPLTGPFANATTILSGTIALVDPDLVVHDDSGNIVFTDNATPGTFSRDATLGAAGDALVALRNIDGMNRDDALFVDAGGNVKLSINSGSGLQAPTVVATGATGGVAVGNFSDDALVDLIVVTAAGGVVFEQSSTTPGTFTQGGTFTEIGGATLLVGDVNGDGLDDVVTPTAVVMQCPTTHAFTQKEPIDATPPAVLVDVTANGKLDLLRLSGTDLVVRVQ